MAGVVKGGPAQKAGIKKGDIIVEVDGKISRERIVLMPYQK